MKEYVKSGWTGLKLVTELVEPGIIYTTDGFKNTFRFQIYSRLDPPLYIQGEYINSLPFDLKLSDKIGDVRTEYLNKPSIEEVGDKDDWKNKFVITNLHRITYKEKECPICIMDIEKGDGIYLDCGHGFHKDCIMQARATGRKTQPCPVCRTQSNVTNLTFQRSRRRRRSKKSTKRRRTKAKKHRLKG